jgi:hypothetical protein
MHPYRDPGLVTPVRESSSDDRMIAGVMFAFGAVRVATAIATGEECGVEATVAAILAVAGGWGLVRPA